MNSTLAIITLAAVLISCAYSSKLDMDFPNCHRSDAFNNAIKECAQQMFGEESDNRETSPQPEHHETETEEVFESCVSQKLGFDCHGTITTDDVNDIMATVVTANEDIRAALTTDLTNCINENQNVGPKVMLCMMESLKKNCS